MPPGIDAVDRNLLRIATWQADADALRALSAEEWSALVERCGAFRLAPLLARLLRAAGIEPPGPARARIAQLAREHVAEPARQCA